jgi:hypothetical protein
MRLYPYFYHVYCSNLGVVLYKRSAHNGAQHLWDMWRSALERLYLWVQMTSFLRAYRKTARHSESKERLLKICVLRHEGTILLGWSAHLHRYPAPGNQIFSLFIVKNDFSFHVCSSGAVVHKIICDVGQIDEIRDGTVATADLRSLKRRHQEHQWAVACAATCTFRCPNQNCLAPSASSLLDE